MNARLSAIIVKDRLQKALDICQNFVKGIKNPTKMVGFSDVFVNIRLMTHIR